jgi:protein TonB
VDAVFVPVSRDVPKLAAAVVGAQPWPAHAAPVSREPRDADSVDQPPRELTNLQPTFPRLAERLRRTGSVRVRLLIDESGRVEDVEVLEVEGHASFEEAVLDVARRWRFDPARDRGRPVRVKATKTVRFEFGS